MLTDEKLLELVYGAVTTYIPFEELSDEQKERFDNIRYQWCNCVRCKCALIIDGKILDPQSFGHANQKTLEIGISKAILRKMLQLTPPIFLLDLMFVTMHEIVHIIFPEFNEEQTDSKAFEWLKANRGILDLEKVNKAAKKEFVKELKKNLKFNIG